MLDAVRDDIDVLRRWAAVKHCEIRHYGTHGAAVATKELLWQGALRVIGKYLWNYGTPIFEEEWDVLVVLDSCRADLMAEVGSEYEFIPAVGGVTKSVGSFTREWMEKNFTHEYADEMARTTYITGNPFSDMLDPSDWDHLIEVWREYRDEKGAVPPRPMTDHAIEATRQFDPDHLIIHYMQPHQPFRSLYGFDDLPDCLSKDVWRLLQLGEIRTDELWRAYRDNLRWVLDDIGLLTTQLGDSQIVITSDHGNAIGEWGIYGHARYLPHPQIKRVPWIRISTQDTDGDYTPTNVAALESDRAEVDVEERLNLLGYR